MKLGKKIVLTCSAIFICGFVFSQSADSLLPYLGIAAKNNPTVLQKFSEYKAALQKVPQVGGLPDPQFNIGVFLEPMELVNGNQIADMRLMQMFPWFGTLSAAKDEMSLMAKAKFESFRDAKFQLFYEVQRSWFEMQKNQLDIRTSEKNIDLLGIIERLTLVKYKATPTGSSNQTASSAEIQPANSKNENDNSGGMNSMGNGSGTAVQPSTSMQGNSMSSQTSGTGMADIYRIQIEMGDLENSIALLKNQSQTLAARFNLYLNRPAGMKIYMPDTLKADTLELSLTAITDSMFAYNPMLGMLDYEQQSLEARKKMVTRMGAPMMGLGVNYSLINKSAMSTSSMNGKDMIMPMATVSLPIYRGKYKAMQNEAELLRNASKLNYQATENSLQTEYYQALQLYKDSQRRIKQYENQRLLAKKALDIMLKTFSTSGADLTDILRIRQQAYDYELKQIEAVADQNTAIAWLKRLTAVTRID